MTSEGGPGRLTGEEIAEMHRQRMVDKIRRFNAVNLMHGYQTIDIRSPKEVVFP